MFELSKVVLGLVHPKLPPIYKIYNFDNHISKSVDFLIVFILTELI